MPLNRPRVGGALFYAITGGLVVAILLAVLHHVHVIWS